MIVKLNTDICPIVVPDTYGNEFCNTVAEDAWDDFKQLMVDKAEEAIEEVLKGLGIGTSLTIGKFHSPKYYNYDSDWIDFDITVPDDYVDTIKRNVRNDEDAFFTFAKNNFGSNNGFVSFYPYKKETFYESEKTEYIISMWIIYRMNEEYDMSEYNYEYLDDIYEYACENGYMELEMEMML